MGGRHGFARFGVLKRITHSRQLGFIVALALVIALGAARIPALAQDPPPDPPPFSLPFADPPGVNTWLYQQHFGNTTAAFNYGSAWYAAGQGLHFGLDLEAPCGTPILAIADGVVTNVDAGSFGAGPHNLILAHPGTGYTSLYGHLFARSSLAPGQNVARGEQIGLSGDPDGTCESRPHLHLEIRSEDYSVSYNPLPFFEVNWHMIASFGPFNHHFQQDIEHPYRWMKLEDQPEVRFGGNLLNKYAQPWPVKLERRAPVSPPAARHLDPLPEQVAVRLEPVALEAWNIGFWWRPGDSAAVYLIDAVPGQPSGVFRQPLDGSPRSLVELAPPSLFSPDGAVRVRDAGGGAMEITRLSDRASWNVYTGGNFPAVSPDGTRLLWEVLYDEITPGQNAPGLEIWVSNVDGSLRRCVHVQSGGWSVWLDAHRLLIVKPIPYMADTQLYVLDIDDPAVTPTFLGSYRFLNGLKVSPGGGHIAFYLTFQENPADSGVYVQATQPGSAPRKLDFTGPYHWRDDRSLYTLSFDASQDAHALGYIDIEENRHRWLTDPAVLPLRIANGEWSVSPDGTQIAFVTPADYGLYRLTVGPG
ncbi:MAG: M23 family metallopeptidase [Chloroflexi bacterium]|nr:M23 family metallopeptidase [Chloroflexota bacterium]